MFNERQLERYARHILLQEVGGPGQQKLLDSKVLVVGAGGLGSPLMLYLAAAGVGTIGVVDDDAVALSNLQRQIAHTEARIGHPKTESAAETVARINPDVTVECHPVRLDPDNAMDLIGRYDLVADGSDNFATRFLINDACYLSQTTLVSASILRFDGQLATFKAHLGGDNPCYRCIFPEAAATGADPLLRGGRYPGRRGRLHGLAAGDRGAEGAARDRREPLRQPDRLRRARRGLPQDQGEARPGVRALQRAAQHRRSFRRREHGRELLRGLERFRFARKRSRLLSLTAAGLRPAPPRGRRISGGPRSRPVARPPKTDAL